jgi:hypothetical protein
VSIVLVVLLLCRYCALFVVCNARVVPGQAEAVVFVPLLAARVLLGVGEGVAFLSIHSMTGKFACRA